LNLIFSIIIIAIDSPEYSNHIALAGEGHLPLKFAYTVLVLTHHTHVIALQD